MAAELALIAKATVILGLALAAARVAHRARASIRALILASAFGLLLVMPVVSTMTPAREVPIPVAIAPPFFLDEPPVVPLDIAGARPLAARPPASAPWRRPSRRDLIRGTWLVGAAIALFPLALGLYRVRHIRRRASPWASATAFADELRANLGLRRAVAVVAHHDIATPITCGWFRPTIVMPIDGRDWSADDLRHALLHELEHVRRHDWPVHVLARLTCALYWFHPAAWMAWRQLSLDSERACDDAVVARAESTAYARQLVALARRVSTAGVDPLLSMADRRTLTTRVGSILSTTVARGRAGAVASGVILTGAAALAAAIAPVTPVGAQSRARDALTIPTSTDGPAFEVVSVKPNEPDDRLRVNDWQPAADRLVLRNLTPQVMLTVAYANTATLFLPDERLLGVPEWAGRERFTIEAIAGRPVTAADLQRMLRRVLVERFGLRVHLEQREQTAYRLTLARADRRLGPNLKRAEEGTCEESRRPRGGGEWGTQELRCVTIDLLALDLAERLGRPVIDQTGLTGIFDGTLTYSPSAEELAVMYRLTPSELPPAAFTGPSLTTALTEQLGLELESTRAAIDVLVVDAIDRPTPNDAPGPGIAAAADGQRPAAFDVASVRLNRSGSEISRGPIIQPGNRFLAQNVMTRVLITTAYGLRWDQVVGGPAWLDSDHWDVEARAGEDATVDDVRAMLRTLLAERFGLTARRETRQRDIYVLTRPGTTRDTPGLRAAATPCTPIRPPGRLPIAAPGTPGPEGEPPVSLGSPSTCERFTFPGYIGARQIGMPEFATLLTMFAGRSVLDRTGMSGDYDVDLTFAPNPAAAADDFAPLPTAVQDQLGLRLEATRGPVDVLVIERIDRPAAN